MPNQKISQLSEVTSLQAADAMVLARGGANRQFSFSSLLSNILAGFTRVTTFNGRSGAVSLQSSDLNGLNGSGLSGIGTGTGGVTNTGTTTIGADTDSDGVGVIALQTRATTRAQIANDGAFEFFGQSAPAASASGKARAYFDSTTKKLMLSQDAGAYFPIGGSLGISINVTGPAYGAVGNGVADDAAAIQAAQNAIEALGSGELLFPPGTYALSVKINITQVKSIRWTGCGPDKTKLISTGGQPCVQANGMWRSYFQGLMFTTNASIGSTASVFELDGNYDGGTHTQSVQGNCFSQCFFDANQLASYSFAVCRQGSSGGQGSENLFLDCNWQGGTEACFLSNGFNALQNTIVGGNFQSYSKHGIRLVAGSLVVLSTGFQSTYRYAQITNGGFDIDCSSGGVNDSIVVIGCRTESLRFYNGGFSQNATLIGNNQTPDYQVWSALTALSSNQITVQRATNGVNTLYRVTTAGTTTGDNVINSDIFSATTIGKTGKSYTTNAFAGWRVTIQGGTGAGQSRVITSNTSTTLTVPTWTTTPDATSDFSIDPTGAWPPTGTFSDGSVVWTVTNFSCMVLLTGASFNNTASVGLIDAARQNWLNAAEVTDDYTVQPDDELIAVNATSKNIVITLVNYGSSSPTANGRPIIVKKLDTTSHTVTVQGTNEGDQVIPGSSRGWVNFVRAGGGSISGGFYVTGKSF